MSTWRGKFTRGMNAGTAVCEYCKRRTQRGIIDLQGWCDECYEAFGLENEHNDHGHAKPVANCPVCHPETDRHNKYQSNPTDN